MACIPGWRATLYASAEGTFGQAPQFAAGDAIEFISFDMGDSQKARTRMRQDRTGKRSVALAEVQGLYEPTTFSFTRSFAPGTTTTVDTHEVLTNAFGTLSTSTYTINQNPTDSLSFCLMDSHATEPQWAEMFMGCVITQVEWSIGENEVLITYTGKAARRGWFYKTTFGADPGGAGTTIQFDNNERVWYPLGIYLDSSDGPETDIVLSATAADYDYTADSSADVSIDNCTRGGSASTKTAGTDYAHPAPLTKTTAKVPVGEHDSTMTLHGTALGFTEASITFNTGRDLREHDRGQSYATAVCNKPLSVEWSVSGIIDENTFDTELGGIANLNQSGAVVFTMGSTSGNIGTLTIAASEIHSHTVTTGGDDPATYSISGTGTGSSGDDDIQLVMS